MHFVIDAIIFEYISSEYPFFNRAWNGNINRDLFFFTTML